MRYFFLAGEASGDQHAADLMRAIAVVDSAAQFAGLGGDSMRQAGCRIYQDYRQMAFMGFEAVGEGLHKLLNPDTART